MRMFNRKAPPEKTPTSPSGGGTKKEAVWMAAGLGGQRLYVIPGRDITIVRFGHPEAGEPFSDGEFLHKVAGTPNSPRREGGDMLAP